MTVRRKNWSCSLYKEVLDMAKEIIFIDTETLTEEELKEILKEDTNAETEG